ncbi:MAG UNVERIFIED_CONTAM: 30S ribosome-binding factor RbfA [Rickettsiaceae bacterium]|jgi:ribosome-binding factor A
MNGEKVNSNSSSRGVDSHNDNDGLLRHYITRNDGKDLSHDERNGSIRQQRVAEMIRAVLVRIVNQGKMGDLRLNSTNLTITSVKISPDLKVANCYVVPFASRISKEELMEALEKSKAYLRMLVTKEVKLKFSPELRFFHDHGLDNSSQVDEILKNLASSK